MIKGERAGDIKELAENARKSINSIIFVIVRDGMIHEKYLKEKLEDAAFYFSAMSYYTEAEDEK